MKVLTILAIGIITLQFNCMEINHKEKQIQNYVNLEADRTKAVVQLCSDYPNRSTLVDKQDLQDSKTLRDSVNSTIGIDGLALLKLLANNHGSQAGTMVTDHLSGPIIFGLQFALGYVILLLIWPFLLCCCLCTCCCRDQQNQKSFKWLLVIVSLGLALAIGTSIYGLTETLSVGDSIQKAGCAAAIVPDDVLYGNITTSGNQFFTGFYNISSQIGQLQGNLDNIANNFSTLMPGSSDPTMDNVFALCQAAKDDTTKISSNDSQGSPLVVTYQTPLNSQSPNSSIASFFPDVLGSVSTQSGIVWQIYSSLDVLNQTLQDLRSNAQNYNNQIGNINKDISSIQSSASQIISSIENADSQVSSYLPQVKNWITISNLSVKIYYGVVIAFSVLGLLAAACIRKSNACIFMMYTSCVVLFFSAVIGFTVSVGFTLALPPLTWSCQYIQNSMNDQSSFKTNFNFLLNNQTIDEIGVCMPYGNGDIISKIGIDAAAGINNLTSVIAQLSSFNISTYKEQILSNFTLGLSYVRDFSNSRILDLQDLPSVKILAELAQTNSPGYQSCSVVLSMDSWVPSAYPNPSFPYIPCTSSSGQVGNETTCPNGVGSVGSCSGCMDTAQILNYYQKNTDKDLLNDLGVRYGQQCTFNQNLNNIWKNYYLVKSNALGPDIEGVPSTSGVLPRTMTVKNDIDNLINSVDPALPNLFSNVLEGLSTISNIVDPKTGLLAGLNCKLMGQDFQRLEQAVCGSLYKDIYATRLALGIASYGILLSLCLFVCMGKHRRRHEFDSSQSYYSSSQENIQQPKYYAMDQYQPNPYK